MARSKFLAIASRRMVLVVIGFAAMTGTAFAQSAKFAGIGRSATPAEIAAWDIDVRPDFKGLPKGAGSVTRGQQVWEAKCESCHGIFGESNEVFTPIVGGTTKRDIEVGNVATLLRPDFPQRTTLMKLSQLSTLWDYINRAMPWNAPKSLSVEDVYAVTAYVLHLGDIIPADFVLSDQNIAEVQKRLPNRNGKIHWTPLWDVKGKGDVHSVACMSNCKQEMQAPSRMPDFARNAHGNIALQNREVGATRGTDTTRPPATERVASPPSAAAPTAVTPASLANKFGCSACHQANARVIGPSHTEIAKKYAGDNSAEAKLIAKVRAGGAGNWGSVPMPPHGHVSDDDLRALVRWSLSGGK